MSKLRQSCVELSHEPSDSACSLSPAVCRGTLIPVRISAQRLSDDSRTV